MGSCEFTVNGRTGSLRCEPGDPSEWCEGTLEREGCPYALTVERQGDN
jgi:hypothetical protein